MGFFRILVVGMPDMSDIEAGGNRRDGRIHLGPVQEPVFEVLDGFKGPFLQFQVPGFQLFPGRSDPIGGQLAGRDCRIFFRLQGGRFTHSSSDR